MVDLQDALNLCLDRRVIVADDEPVRRERSEALRRERAELRRRYTQASEDFPRGAKIAAAGGVG